MQKMKERLRFHAKILDVSMNLGLNLLLNHLLCVSLDEIALTSLLRCIKISNGIVNALKER
jgi:hypothetical protein